MTPALRRFLVLRALGGQADYLLQFLVPVLVFRLTGSALAAGLAFFVEWVPRLAAMPLAGPMVDRFGVRPAYLAAAVVRTTAVLSAMLVLGTRGPAAVAVVGLAVAAGGCSDVVFIAGEKAVRILAPTREIPRAQSALGAVDQVTSLVAPVLGGLLVVFLGETALAAAGLLFLADLALVVTMPDHGGRGSAEPVLGRVAAGARWVWREPVLRVVVGLTMLVNLLVGLVIAATPAVLIGHFGLTAAHVSLLYTAGGLASLGLLAGTPWLIRRFGVYRVAGVSALGTCLAMLLSAAAPGPALFITLSAGVLAAVSVFTVAIRTVRARLVPAAGFGTATGVILSLNFLTLPVSGLLLAGFSHWSAPLPALYGATGGVALAVCLVLLRRLGVHRQDGAVLVQGQLDGR